MLKSLEGTPAATPAFAKFYGGALYDRLLGTLLLMFAARLQQEALARALERARQQHADDGAVRGGGGAAALCECLAVVVIYPTHRAQFLVVSHRSKATPTQTSINRPNNRPPTTRLPARPPRRHRRRAHEGVQGG